jgi:hypothetical protein
MKYMQLRKVVKMNMMQRKFDARYAHLADRSKRPFVQRRYIVFIAHMRAAHTQQPPTMDTPASQL